MAEIKTEPNYGTVQAKSKTNKKPEVAKAPEYILKSTYTYSEEELQQKLDDIDQDIYISTQNHKKSDIGTYILIFITTVLTIIGLKKLYKLFKK